MGGHTKAALHRCSYKRSVLKICSKFIGQHALSVISISNRQQINVRSYLPNRRVARNKGGGEKNEPFLISVVPE